MGVGERLTLLAMPSVHKNGETILMVREKQPGNRIVERQNAYAYSLTLDDLGQILNRRISQLQPAPFIIRDDVALLYGFPFVTRHRQLI